MTAVACASLCFDECGIFHFDGSLCETFQEDRYESTVSTAGDFQWTLGLKVIDSISDGSWRLVFRAQSDIGVSVYDTWTDTGVVNDAPIPVDFPNACLRFDNYLSCDRHYRSSFLDNWANVSEVRLSLYKWDTQVAYVTFNGHGSDRDSWFALANIIDSTWAPSILGDDLHPPVTIEGWVYLSDDARRFYLFGRHVGCANDWFYTFTFDQAVDSCVTHGYWSISLGSFPKFFYSPSSGRASPANSAPYPAGEFADVLAIWVKLV